MAVSSAYMTNEGGMSISDCSFWFLYHLLISNHCFYFWSSWLHGQHGTSYCDHMFPSARVNVCASGPTCRHPWNMVQDGLPDCFSWPVYHMWHRLVYRYHSFNAHDTVIKGNIGRGKDAYYNTAVLLILAVHMMPRLCRKQWRWKVFGNFSCMSSTFPYCRNTFSWVCKVRQ